MPVSIREVAARVGVSPGTVSHVLNGNTHARIAVETQNRVRRAAEEMGYQPNRLARSLGRGRTDTLGIIVSGIRNPFFADIVETLEGLAVEAGLHAIVEVTPQPPGDTVRHGNLSGWPVDGILLWSQPWQTLADRAGRGGHHSPVVYLGYPRTDDTDWVAFDLASGGRMMAEHLLEQGYRRIWYLTPFAENVPRPKEARVIAYADVCQERGLPSRVVLLPRNEESRQAGLELALGIAALPSAERPDALLCHNDIVAVGVYHGLVRAGIDVPKEIAVAGFDGLMEGQCLDRPLTTVLTSASDLCRSAVDLLVRRIAGDTAPCEGISIPGRLLVGATT